MTNCFNLFNETTNEFETVGFSSFSNAFGNHGETIVQPKLTEQSATGGLLKPDNKFLEHYSHLFIPFR